MGACESCCEEPIFLCMTCCDRRVIWRGEAEESPRLVALTLHDVPRCLDDLARLLFVLQTHGAAKATFFVRWSDFANFCDRKRFVVMLRDNGHEIAIDLAPSWGCSSTSDAHLCQQAVEVLHALQRLGGVVPRYVRTPGGLSCRSTVTKLEGLGLTVVHHAAAAALLQQPHVGPSELGRCGPERVWRGGRIATLHGIAKVEAFLEQARCNDCRVVRLDTLLDKPPAFVWKKKNIE